MAARLHFEHARRLARQQSPEKKEAELAVRLYELFVAVEALKVHVVHHGRSRTATVAQSMMATQAGLAEDELLQPLDLDGAEVADVRQEKGDTERALRVS